MKVTNGTITSGFGMRMHPVEKVMKMHNGIDISAPMGTPVYCPESGQVVACVFSPTAGNFVHVRCGDRTFIFMHLQAFFVANAQQVVKGQQIGAVGNTGVATGPHLHFEVRNVMGVPVDPTPYINF